MMATFYNPDESPRYSATAAFALNIRLIEITSCDVYLGKYVKKGIFTEIQKTKERDNYALVHQ